MKYKIDEEDFDKLSQINRIEYRQIKNKIEENHNFSFFGFLGSSVYAWLLVFIAMTQIAFINRAVLPQVLLAIKEVTITFFLIIIFGGLILDAYLMTNKKKEMNKLNNKFFSASLSVKKVK